MDAVQFAVIYCRVSDKKQKKNGDGLKSQERTCRAYASHKHYTVLDVFEDDITGGTVSRNGMDSLLQFLDANHRETGKETVVLIDDIKRFARHVESHFDLKHEVTKRGGRLESPLFRFEDTPEGKFMETLFAAQAELERSQNARQVRRRMQARLEQGFWGFHIPPGYKFVMHPLHKKVITRDPIRAELVTEALEGFAGNRFGSVAEVYRFLRDAGFFGVPHRKYQARDTNRVHRMLRNPLYTGHLAFPSWGVSLRKAFHPALISLEAFDRIQEKLAANSTPVRRADTKVTFPLRNFVSCGACGSPLTASCSRGRQRTYAYYHCFKLTCPRYGKGEPKAAVEGAFEALLKEQESDDATVDLAKAIAMKEWLGLEDQQRDVQQVAGRRRNEVDREISRVADRIAVTTNDAVYKALEAKIEQLTHERCRLEETVSVANTPRPEFGTQFERVRAMLQRPLDIWKTGDEYLQRVIVRRVFPGRLTYERNRGFGTPDLSLPYFVMQQLRQSNCEVVDHEIETSNSTNLKVRGQLEPGVWGEFIACVQEWASWTGP